MADMDKIARQLSSGHRLAQDFEQRYGPHALIRERQELLRAFEPPPYIKDMMRMEEAAQRAILNPFEEMMRSIRPTLDDFRLRAGLDQTTLSSIQSVAESLSRPSDILRQIGAFEGFGHSAIAEMMQSQSAMAEAAIGMRKSLSGFDLPELFPHDRVAGALAGIHVLSEQSEAMRMTAATALASVQGYQAFAERQLRRVETDHPDVFARRILVTDLAGDLLETAQSSWEILGLHASLVPEEPVPETLRPTIYTHLNRQLAYLYRGDAQTDPHIAFDQSTAFSVATLAGEIVDLIYSVNETRAASQETLIITPTNHALRAVHRLTSAVCTDERSFGEIVDALYCLLYEGSGYANRLTSLMKDKDLAPLWWVKSLRTSFRHDVDHGDPRKSQKKHVEIGEIYFTLVGSKRPKRPSDWSAAQVALFEHTADFLRKLLDVVAPD